MRSDPALSRLRWPLLASGVVLLAGGIGHRWVDRLLLAADAAPAPLKAPLATLPMVIGPWEGTEIPMDKRVLEVAGTDDHVYRRYINKDPGLAVDLYIAYAARPVKLLSHRPQVCYPAHGWTPAGTRTESVPLADGSELPCLIHRFTRSDAGSDEIVVLNYYILRGQYVTDWTEFWGPTWRLPNIARDPSFYVLQVQLSGMAGSALSMEGVESTLKSVAALTAGNIRAALPAPPGQPVTGAAH